MVSKAEALHTANTIHNNSKVLEEQTRYFKFHKQIQKLAAPKKIKESRPPKSHPKSPSKRKSKFKCNRPT